MTETIEKPSEAEIVKLLTKVRGRLRTEDWSKIQIINGNPKKGMQ